MSYLTRFLHLRYVRHVKSNKIVLELFQLHNAPRGTNALSVDISDGQTSTHVATVPVPEIRTGRGRRRTDTKSVPGNIKTWRSKTDGLVTSGPGRNAVAIDLDDYNMGQDLSDVLKKLRLYIKPVQVLDEGLEVKTLLKPIEVRVKLASLEGNRLKLMFDPATTDRVSQKRTLLELRLTKGGMGFAGAGSQGSAGNTRFTQPRFYFFIIISAKCQYRLVSGIGRGFWLLVHVCWGGVFARISVLFCVSFFQDKRGS